MRGAKLATHSPWWMALLLALALPGVAGGDPMEALQVIQPKQRMEAPEIELDRLGGDRESVRNYAGDLVLVHFFATWCLPCRQELPAVEVLWKRYRARGFTVLAVAADVGNPRAVEEFAAELGLTFPVLLDPKGTMRREYEVVGLPYSYLVGRDGRFRGKIIGERKWSGPEAVAVIEQLLAESSSGAPTVESDRASSSRVRSGYRPSAR